MDQGTRQVIVVRGGTAGSVLAARLSEVPGLFVTLLEAGPDHDAYDDSVLDPARTPEAWTGGMSVARVARKMTAAAAG